MPETVLVRSEMCINGVAPLWKKGKKKWFVLKLPTVMYRNSVETVFPPLPDYSASTSDGII